MDTIYLKTIIMKPKFKTPVYKEKWRPIAGFEGRYSVSDHGRVMSHLNKHNIKNRILKATDDGNGYDHVTLSLGNKLIKTFTIHRLVAIAFLEKINGKNIINHKDGNKKNNMASNLEWCTVSENTLHAFKLGLFVPPITPKMGGDLHPSVKIKEHNFEEIFKLKQSGMRNYKIAEIFEVSGSTIGKIISGKRGPTYKHKHISNKNPIEAKDSIPFPVIIDKTVFDMVDDRIRITNVNEL